MNPQINLLHLKFLCDAACYSSISEAAKINFVTQSTVSQGISKLEKILGKTLLVHSRKKFCLTEEGKIVFEQARHVFKSIQHIYDEIQQKDQPSGILNFVTTKSLGTSFLPFCYKKMKSNFPQLQLGIKLGGLSYIRNLIKQGQVEFGVVLYDKNFSQFAKHTLWRGKFNLYHCADANFSSVTQGIFVNYYEGTYVRELNDYLFKCSDLKIETELSGWEIIARFTELNLGIGFFPDYILTNQRYPLIKVYPLELPPFDYEICVIYNKDEKLSRAACTFIDQFTLNET